MKLNQFRGKTGGRIFCSAVRYFATLKEAIIVVETVCENCERRSSSLRAISKREQVLRLLHFASRERPPYPRLSSPRNWRERWRFRSISCFTMATSRPAEAAESSQAEDHRRHRIWHSHGKQAELPPKIAEVLEQGGGVGPKLIMAMAQKMATGRGRRVAAEV